MNSIKYLLLLLLFILAGCTDSNNKNSNTSSINEISYTDQSNIDSMSAYSKCLEMLNEYESILDELQNLSLAVEAKDLEALSDVVKISQVATQWVEKWKKIIQNQDLNSDEINQLIQKYEDLLKKYN